MTQPDTCQSRYLYPLVWLRFLPSLVYKDCYAKEQKNINHRRWRFSATARYRWSLLSRTSNNTHSREPTLVSPRATPEPTEELSPTPSETPTPTGKPTPTATVKPTSSPTNTPTPTPTPAPSVVNIETSVSPSGTTTTCNSQTFTFTAKIYTNAATTVKYTWLRSDNASGAEQSITFTGAGMQSVTNTWTMTQSSGTHYNGWQRIKVISPNDALSNQAEFTLACP